MKNDFMTWYNAQSLQFQWALKWAASAAGAVGYFFLAFIVIASLGHIWWGFGLFFFVVFLFGGFLGFCYVVLAPDEATLRNRRGSRRY